MQNGKVAATAWLDRKVVTAMSSNSQPTASGTVLRRVQDRSRVSVPCPQSILLYNKFMGGVDRGDQLRGYYSCRYKSRKFYKYIFFFLLDVAITNAFILHKHFAVAPKVKNVKEFRMKLAAELIGEYCSRRTVGRSGSSIVSLPLRHFPIKLDADMPTKRCRGRCAQCKKCHQRTDTQWYCQECGVWLCHSGNPIRDCFFAWHKHQVGTEL